MTKFVNDRHDIAKKLLKVALNTITLNHNHCIVISKSGGGNEEQDRPVFDTRYSLSGKEYYWLLIKKIVLLNTNVHDSIGLEHVM
jgi:hypothetical protein